MTAVVRDQRYCWPRAEKAANTARIDHKIVAHVDVPLLHEFRERRRRGRIQQDQHAAAFVQKALDLFHLVGERLRRRSSHHQEGCVIGNLALFDEINRLNNVIFFLRSGLGIAVTVAVVIVDFLFTMPLD